MNNRIKKSLQILTVAILCAAASYGTVGFFLWEFNPFFWSMEIRLLTIVVYSVVVEKTLKEVF